MDNTTPNLTEAKLRAKIEAAEMALGVVDEFYTAILPVVSCSSYQRATFVTQQLKDALMAEFPARTHVFINPFAPNIWLDDKTAVVLHDGKKHEIPADQLVAYYLEDGHKVPE